MEAFSSVIAGVDMGDVEGYSSGVRLVRVCTGMLLFKIHIISLTAQSCVLYPVIFLIGT